MRSQSYIAIKLLLLTALLTTLFTAAYGQDTSEINTILRGCLKDAYRLDSSLAQHQVKDSLIVELYELSEQWRYKSYLQEGMISNKDTIISRQYEVEETYKEELKQEKKKKRIWQITSGGLVVLLILLI